MVVAPLTRFAPRDSSARRNVIPSTGTVVDRVQQESLMLRVGAEVRPGRIEQRVEDPQARLLVPRAGGAAVFQDESEPQQALRGDRRRRTVDRLDVVERI